MNNDEKWMVVALQEALKAEAEGEVPIGAVLVKDGMLIAKAHNQPISKNDATAHAEIQLLRVAGKKLKNYRQINSTIYVSLEPCAMCGGAAFWTQISKVIYGAKDEKRGFSTLEHNILHPKTNIQGGILEKDCAKLLSDFFKSKR